MEVGSLGRIASFHRLLGVPTVCQSPCPGATRRMAFGDKDKEQVTEAGANKQGSWNVLGK